MRVSKVLAIDLQSYQLNKQNELYQRSEHTQFFSRLWVQSERAQGPIYILMLDKLCKYGVRGRPQACKQLVHIGNEKSSLLEMTCNVPQGATLGPLLFLIYITDIAILQMT